MSTFLSDLVYILVYIMKPPVKPRYAAAPAQRPEPPSREPLRVLMPRRPHAHIPRMHRALLSAVPNDQGAVLGDPARPAFP